MSNPRIKTEFRLELSNPKVVGDQGNRVWVDVTVDGSKVQGTCIFSGPREAAQAIVDGTVRIQEDGVLLDVTTGEPHPDCVITNFRRREEARKKRDLGRRNA